MPEQPVLSLNPPVLHGGAGDNRMTKQSDHQIGLRRCPARIGRIGWLAVATQVIENPRNHCGFLDTGDHPQLPATAPTDLDVDRECLASQPLWLQAIEILVIGDLVAYWMHRWFHGRGLWKFHAIHHCSKDLDWLSPVRLHPVNDCRVCRDKHTLRERCPEDVVFHGTGSLNTLPSFVG